MRTLVVTNDYPPRPGGIQAYLHALVSRQPTDEVVVLASSWRDAEAFDAVQTHPVVRASTGVLLPTVRTLRLARDVARAENCDRVWFGAAAPLGLLAPYLPVERTVASTYGHELIWAALPGSRQALRRIGRHADAVTYLAEYTRERLAPVIEAPLVAVPSGVDPTVFRPDCGGDAVRARHGLTGRPVIVCVSRLVPRKGQDVLLRALPLVRKDIPEATLLLVGGGPSRAGLERSVREQGLEDAVVLTGSVPWEELPAHYDAGDVFAMPCRSRVAGLEVEGLGIVFLEASATGLPVVAGRSGGSPDTVQDGVTGHLVDGTSVPEVAARVTALLSDPGRARAMGAAGRRWMQESWGWEHLASRLRSVLSG